MVTGNWLKYSSRYEPPRRFYNVTINDRYEYPMVSWRFNNMQTWGVFQNHIHNSRIQFAEHSSPHCFAVWPFALSVPLGGHVPIHMHEISSSQFRLAGVMVKLLTKEAVQCLRDTSLAFIQRFWFLTSGGSSKRNGGSKSDVDNEDLKVSHSRASSGGFRALELSSWYT